MFFRTIHQLFVCACLLCPVWSEAKSIQVDLAALTRDSAKAVVNISAVRRMDSRGLQGECLRSECPDSPFDEFPDRFSRFFAPEAISRQHSRGSGFLISADGYIVTANHLIAGAEEIRVLLHGEQDHRSAILVGHDSETELALLKIDTPQSLPSLAFADSERTKVGDWVLAIGNPFGLDHSVTLGIISAKDRVLGAGPFDDFIQTDVSINPGNSGGPLINLSGAVIGVNTAVMSNGQGISFAVPSSLARRVIHELKMRGRVVRGWLGVSVQDTDSLTAKALGLPSSGGALVSGLIPDSAADRAGIRIGDVILRLHHQAIEDARDLLRTVAALQPGQEAEITVWRNGQERHLTALVDSNDDKPLRQSSGNKLKKNVSTMEGLTLRPITKSESTRLGLNSPYGLLVLYVEPDSAAEEAGLQAGDLIMQTLVGPYVL